MWKGTLLSLYVLAGSYALNQNEWRTNVIESYAKWTIAANTPEHDGFWNLYSTDYVELLSGAPALNYQEARNSFTKQGYFPLWIYLSLHELVYSNEEIALAWQTCVKHQKSGVYSKGKGIRIYKIEDGQVKVWL